jgi:hypothetical protein
MSKKTSKPELTQGVSATEPPGAEGEQPDKAEYHPVQ